MACLADGKVRAVAALRGAISRRDTVDGVEGVCGEGGMEEGEV